MNTLEITKVILEQREMSVPLGSGVMIPCSFSTNTPNVLPKTVSLEWRFKPEDSHLSTPIIILITTMVEQELKPNDRIHVFEDLVTTGNCSLVIDHTFLSDSGTYQVYLSVDGVLFKESLRVELKVFGEEQTEDHAIRLMGSRPRKYDDEEDVDQEILSFIQKYQQLQKSGMIYVILAFGGLIIIILIGGSVWGVYTMVQYFKLKKTLKDLMLRMEQGVSSYKDHQSIQEEENISTSQTSSSADD